MRAASFLNCRARCKERVISAELRRLLLRHAMDSAQAPDKVSAVDADGFAIRLLDDESTVATAIALMVAARYSDV